MDALAQDIGGSDSLRSMGRVRRFWWLVLLGALVGLVAGAAATTLVSKQYTSTTAIVVYPPANQTSVSGARTNASVNMDNQLQFMNSAAVATVAKGLLKVPAELPALEAQLTATVPPNTSVLDVAFSAGTPKKARAGSEAFAQAFLYVRQQQSAALVSAQVAALTTQLGNLQVALAGFAAQVGTGQKGSVAAATAQAQLTITQNSINNLNARLSPLKAADTTAGAIIQPATVPGTPSKPVPALYAGSGLFAGLVIGLLLAVLATRRDRKVRSLGDVTDGAGRPVLASIPAPGRGNWAGGVLTARTGAGEFDRLRLRLESATPDRAGSVVVTTPQQGHGSSFVAGNLALSMARAGSEVVLVVADPDSSTDTLFGLEDSPGLSTALLGDHGLEDVAQAVPGRPRLRVVVPGKDLADVYDRVPAQRVAALADRLVQAGHRVILEAPAIELGTQAQELARWAGSALVVVELAATENPAVRHAFDELDQSGAFVPGAVVVPAVPMPARPTGREVTERATVETVSPSRP